MTARIVLLGATGYTGGLVLEALLRRGLAPVLAGRDRDALAALAHPAGLDHAHADATDERSVTKLCAPGDILVTTVGPFERFGYSIARAAAQAGAHYIDSTGEVGFVRNLQQLLHNGAVQANTVMLPAFGYDYVPGILAGTLAAQQAGATARTVDIGYFATGPLWRGLSQGTRTTMRDGLSLPSTRWHNRSLVDVRTASHVQSFNVRGHRKNAFLVSGTEVLYLPKQFPALDNVTVYNGWFPKLSRAANALSALAAVASRTQFGDTLVETLTRPIIGPPGGPDIAERDRTRTHVVAVATDHNGPRAEIHLEGPSIYNLTGELIAWAADQIAAGRHRASGIIGPVQAFGLDALQSGCNAIGLTATHR
jgi:short subunit dehydrogenase-like uncharacterized protein